MRQDQQSSEQRGVVNGIQEFRELSLGTAKDALRIIYEKQRSRLREEEEQEDKEQPRAKRGNEEETIHISRSIPKRTRNGNMSSPPPDNNNNNNAAESEQKNLHLDQLQKENAAFSNSSNARSNPNSIRNLIDIYNFEWTEHLVYTIIALVIQFALGQDYVFPDGIDEATGRACSEFGNHKMCGLELSLERAQGQLRFLTPFVLGGYVVSTVNLWRERRTAYLALCGAVRNMNVNLGSLLPLPREAPKGDRVKIIHARKTMARWGLLGYELSVLKARGQIDVAETAIPHLKELGLLQEGEWEAMVPGDRHTTVWLWLQTKAVKSGKEGIIDQTLHVQTLCNAVTLIRDRANDLMSSLNRDQPFPYASICGLLVNFYLLFNALWRGVEWAIWFYEVGWHLYYTPQIYIEIVVLLVTSMLFGMLYDLSHILYNPFGMRSFDLPHVAVGGGIRKMGRAFASGDYLPPTMDAPKMNNNNNNNNNDNDDDDDDVEDDLDLLAELQDNGVFIPEPVDRLQSDRRGSLFAGLSKKRT